MGRSRKLTIAQSLEMCQMYERGQSLRSLGRAFGICAATVLRYLEGHGIQTRGISDALAIHNGPGYECHFLDVIDSETKAYLLGFLAADGSVRGNCLRMNLCMRDLGHLEWVRRVVGDVGKLVIRSQQRTTGMAQLYCEWSVHSRSLVEALAAYAIVPNKIRTLPFPRLEADLIRHYIRGYVDGNGGLYGCRGTRGRDMQFQVTSNRAWCEGAQAILMSACGLRRTKLDAFPVGRSGIEVFGLRWNGRRQVCRIYHYLYDGATCWLPRKRQHVEPYTI